MNFTKIIEELRAELAAIDAAIANLEKIGSPERRRGRPQKMNSQTKPSYIVEAILGPNSGDGHRE